MAERTFDRMVPPDWRHVETHPLRALPRRLPTYAPVVWGINWYSNFDRPERLSGHYFIGRGSLGSIRGGHAIASPPAGAADRISWQVFYDQGSEGACVGYSVSRAATWLNRKRYDATWLYREAQKIDYWEGEDYEGTSVRAGMEVLRDEGHRIVGRGGKVSDPEADEGIASYWWALGVEEILPHFGPFAERIGAIPLTNSWGKDYPRVVWLPAETAQRLIDEDGEIGVLLDR